jgi:hypothetical protein
MCRLPPIGTLVGTVEKSREPRSSGLPNSSATPTGILRPMSERGRRVTRIELILRRKVRSSRCQQTPGVRWKTYVET